MHPDDASAARTSRGASGDQKLARPNDDSEPPPTSRPAADPARERRVKALSCTEPLHGLHTNRARRGWEKFDFYDLGLAAVDAVVDRMGFDTGISRSDLHALVVTEARRFGDDVDLNPIASELIETLIRPNVAEYTSALDEVRRRFDFALLTEHENAEGGIYLRATNEAINVLVGGLNTDIESAQVAAEATLEHLIRRRRLDDAARPAREAKMRSIQYANYVRQIIDETRRDIRRAGWREDVPSRLADIRDHLLDRMQTEERLLAAMQDARDTAAREDLRRQAAALVETVDDCFIRHQELHATALAAVRVYVQEQDRQVFGRAAVIGAVDLTEEVFLPVLGASVQSVADILTTFAERVLGFGPGAKSRSLVPVRQPRFGLLVLALLRPPMPRDTFGGEVDDPEWDAQWVDPFAFSNDAWAAADAVLDQLEAPTRLSVLLEAAGNTHGFDVADLLRLRALVATAPDLEAVRPGAPPVLAAVGDGVPFTCRWFEGSDLLIGMLTADDVAYNGTMSDDIDSSPPTPPAQTLQLSTRARSRRR